MEEKLFISILLGKEKEILQLRAEKAENEGRIQKLSQEKEELEKKLASRAPPAVSNSAVDFRQMESNMMLMAMQQQLAALSTGPMSQLGNFPTVPPGFTKSAVKETQVFPCLEVPFQAASFPTASAPVAAPSMTDMYAEFSSKPVDKHEIPKWSEEEIGVIQSYKKLEQGMMLRSMDLEHKTSRIRYNLRDGNQSDEEKKKKEEELEKIKEEWRNFEKWEMRLKTVLGEEIPPEMKPGGRPAFRPDGRLEGFIKTDAGKIIMEKIEEDQLTQEQQQELLNEIEKQIETSKKFSKDLETEINKLYDGLYVEGVGTKEARKEKLKEKKKLLSGVQQGIVQLQMAKQNRQAMMTKRSQKTAQQEELAEKIDKNEAPKYSPHEQNLILGFLKEQGDLIAEQALLSTKMAALSVEISEGNKQLTDEEKKQKEEKIEAIKDELRGIDKRQMNLFTELGQEIPPFMKPGGCPVYEEGKFRGFMKLDAGKMVLVDEGQLSEEQRLKISDEYTTRKMNILDEIDRLNIPVPDETVEMRMERENLVTEKRQELREIDTMMEHFYNFNEPPKKGENKPNETPEPIPVEKTAPPPVLYKKPKVFAKRRFLKQTKAAPKPRAAPSQVPSISSAFTAFAPPRATGPFNFFDSSDSPLPSSTFDFSRVGSDPYGLDYISKFHQKFFE